MTAGCHNTRFAPGISRNARVSAQLNATVSTKPIVAFTIAGEAAVSVKALSTAFEGWLPAYMNAKV